MGSKAGARATAALDRRPASLPLYESEFDDLPTGDYERLAASAPDEPALPACVLERAIRCIDKEDAEYGAAFAGA